MRRQLVELQLLLLLLALSLAPPLFAQTDEGSATDLAHVAALVGAPQGPGLGGEVLEVEAKRVASLLRCPVCQGLSVWDSPSPMATNMRQRVRELVAAGFVEEQVLSYFEISYGEFVRLEPPLRGVNWLVWLAPAAGLGLGLALVLWVLRGARAVRATQPIAADVERAPSAGPVERDALPADPALAAALLRVRATAYGWPGGRKPEAS